MMKDLVGKKILVVDDEEFNVFILENVLELERANVISVSDGELALDYLESNDDVDIVLTDIMMPNLNGYELISKIGSREEFGHIPVIAVSAKMIAGEEEKCKELGAVDYLNKPLDMDKLIDVIKFHLNNKDYVRIS